MAVETLMLGRALNAGLRRAMEDAGITPADIVYVNSQNTRSSTSQASQVASVWLAR